MVAKSLAIEQMYNVLRGLPGTMELSAASGDRFLLTVVNPNAPVNRCQETLGLRIALEGPVGSKTCSVIERVLSEQELTILRSGEPLDLAFGDIEVTFRSNPGGQHVRLPEARPAYSSERKTSDVEILRRLGKTGLSVFPVGLGAMQLSMNSPPSEDVAIDVINAALELGINFIDTANVYCSNGEIGHNERLIRKALALTADANSVIVATKGGVDKSKGKIDASPNFLRNSCLQSLKDLGQETISLYQLHAPDNSIPIEESVGELSRLQEEGKILHIGLCNVNAEDIGRAQAVCRIESVQNACNPFNAGDYFDSVIETCRQHEMSFFPHSVLGGRSAFKQLESNGILAKIGNKHGVSPYTVVVAWHLYKDKCVIPIPGASRLQSVVSSAESARLDLSFDDVSEVDSIWLAES